MIAFARETWIDDGAEGETVHKLCDELESFASDSNLRGSTIHVNIPSIQIDGLPEFVALVERFERAAKLLA